MLAATQTALKNLKSHRKAMTVDMRKAFAGKTDRFAEFSACQEDLLLDYSKCAVTAKSMKLLLALARSADVARKRDAMFAGAKINETEGRAVLHTALRNLSGAVVPYEASFSRYRWARRSRSRR